MVWSGEGGGGGGGGEAKITDFLNVEVFFVEFSYFWNFLEVSGKCGTRAAVLDFSITLMFGHYNQVIQIT